MIYKIVILGIITVATLAAKLPNLDGECVPGASFRIKCNDCLCLGDGSAVCTRKLCPDLAQNAKLIAGIVKETKCIPGERFEDECGPCVCMVGGIPACRNKFCMN